MIPRELYIQARLIVKIDSWINPIGV